MYSPDLSFAHVFGILEGVSQNSLRGCPCNEFDALDDAVDHDVLNPRVLPLSILSYEYSVDIVVRGLVTRDGFARTDVGEKIESTAKSEIEGDVTFSYRRLQPNEFRRR